MTATYLFVDGNYLFHVAKQAGLQQDFQKLEKALETHGGFARKFFYTRPPTETSVKSVVGWLKAHDWEVTVLPYEYTHQDSLYVPMVADMFSLNMRSEDTLTTIISGSGALAHPLQIFPRNVRLCATEDSINKKLKTVLNTDYVEFVSLIEVLRG